MPTYAFKCSECDHSFDRFLSMSRMDEPLTAECPACGVVGTIKRDYSTSSYVVMDPVALGRQKAPADFRNFLSNVKKANPGSFIKDR